MLSFFNGRVKHIHLTFAELKACEKNSRMMWKSFPLLSCEKVALTSMLLTQRQFRTEEELSRIFNSRLLRRAGVISE